MCSGRRSRSVSRSTPIILLVEEDEFDRMTLTRMLNESGCRVMAASRAARGLDAFTINHANISLVLASTRLTDAERIRLVEALHRIDARVPVVVAGWRASHRPNSGEDSGRSSIFAELIADVLDHLRVPHPLSPQPLKVRPIEYEPQEDAGVYEDEFDDEPVAVTPAPRLPPLPTPDLRSYLADLSRARQMRRRRFRAIGITVAAGCAPLVITTLLRAPATTARATEEATISATASSPLPSVSLSDRVGIVPLVSGPRVHRSSLADDLLAWKSPARKSSRAR
jgi:CheY-like chemotaxis protein